MRRKSAIPILMITGMLSLADCLGIAKGKTAGIITDVPMHQESLEIVPMRFTYPSLQGVSYLSSEQFLLCRRKEVCPIRRDFTPVPVPPPAPEPVSAQPVHRKLEMPRRVIVHFPSGSSTLEPEAVATLDQLASELRGADLLSLRMVTAGYTDSVGPLKLNKKLAEDRAQAVAAYFREKGVITKEIDTGGRPLCCYIAPNSTPEGRAKNRRAEIWISPAEEKEDENKK